MKRMQHTWCALTVVAVGLVVALSLGAAPALAADGCDCHTAVPPTATPAHAPYVAAVTDCATCHVDLTVPHPEPPVLALFAMDLVASPEAAASQLSGFVGTAIFGHRTPHPGVVVYLQQRLWGATSFTDLGQVVTNEQGRYTFTVASPQRLARYRAVAVGHLGTTQGGETRLFAPALRRAPSRFPTTVTGKLVGLRRGVIRAGRALTVRGTLRPVEAAGNKVLVRIQRYDRGARPHWQTVRERARVTSSTGSYSRSLTLRRAGLYRAKTLFKRTADWRATSSAWHKFRVTRP
jgi:hypothetical protein